MGSIRFPYIADLTVSSSFVFVSHVESPVRGYSTRVRTYSLREGSEKQAEAYVEGDEEKTPKSRGFGKEEGSEKNEDVTKVKKRN